MTILSAAGVPSYDDMWANVNVNVNMYVRARACVCTQNEEREELCFVVAITPPCGSLSDRQNLVLSPKHSLRGTCSRSRRPCPGHGNRRRDGLVNKETNRLERI